MPEQTFSDRLQKAAAKNTILADSHFIHRLDIFKPENSTSKHVQPPILGSLLKQRHI